MAAAITAFSWPFLGCLGCREIAPALTAAALCSGAGGTCCWGRLRLVVRQLGGAPVNNPRVMQLLYTQAYAAVTRGHYVLDLQSVPLLAAIHLQIEHGDDDQVS
jgi:hypothetical protein